MIVYIDHPDGLEISHRFCEIRGWLTVPESGSGRVRLEIEGIPVLCTFARRPDVEAAHPGQAVVGFSLSLDLTYYMRAIRDSSLHLRLIAGPAEEVVLRFKVCRAMIGACMAAAGGL